MSDLIQARSQFVFGPQPLNKLVVLNPAFKNAVLLLLLLAGFLDFELVDLGLRKLLDFDQDLRKLTEVSFDCLSETTALLGFLLLGIHFVSELNQGLRVEVACKVENEGLSPSAQVALGVQGLGLIEQALRKGLGGLQFISDHGVFTFHL